MKFGPKKPSTDNPGLDAFDAGQKRLLPFVLVVTALAAIVIEGASLAVLPILLIIGAIYLFVVVAGARIVRTLGLKLLNRKPKR